MARDVFVKYEERTYMMHKMAIGTVLILMTITFTIKEFTQHDSHLGDFIYSAA